MRNFFISLALLACLAVGGTGCAHNRIQAMDLPMPQTANDWLVQMDSLAVDALAGARVACLFKNSNERERCDTKVRALDSLRIQAYKEAAILIPMLEQAEAVGDAEQAKVFRDGLLSIATKLPGEFIQIRKLVERLLDK